jgi:hypothetical protein
MVDLFLHSENSATELSTQEKNHYEGIHPVLSINDHPQKNKLLFKSVSILK